MELSSSPWWTDNVMPRNSSKHQAMILTTYFKQNCRAFWKQNPYLIETTYALKTPNAAVFLTVILLSQFSWRHSVKIPSETFFDLVILTFDLWPWPRYPFTWLTCRNSSPYVCPFGCESGSRQTDTRCQNYYTWNVTDMGCNYHRLKYRGSKQHFKTKIEFRILISLSWWHVVCCDIVSHIAIALYSSGIASLNGKYKIAVTPKPDYHGSDCTWYWML